ncbi:MAG: acyltransferase [Vicinamibacterales bacterium]
MTALHEPHLGSCHRKGLEKRLTSSGVRPAEPIPASTDDCSRQRFVWLDLARGVSLYAIVLIHVVLMLHGDAQRWFVRLRDFAFPLMILSSFFVLTLAIGAGGQALPAMMRRRALRLWVPAVIWTLAYWFAWPGLVLLLGEPAQFAPLPEVRLLVGGFMHLWYLQFLFLASLVALCVLRAGRRAPSWVLQAPLWFALAGICLWARPLVVDRLAPLTEPGLFSWTVFKRQSLIHAHFIPLGIACGLMANAVHRAGADRRIRRLAVATAVVAATIYLAFPGVRLLREVYSLTVFATLLMPWPSPGWRLPWLLAEYSYIAYILHYGIAQAVAAIILRATPDVSDGGMVAASVMVYATSLGAALALRRLCPVDWLFPMVKVARHPSSRFFQLSPREASLRPGRAYASLNHTRAAIAIDHEDSGGAATRALQSGHDQSRRT